MRQYQREIFEWNKNDLAAKMDPLSFAFKIVPYRNAQWAKLDKYVMEHHDTPAYNEDEQALHNLLSYRQSFFWFNSTVELFPVLNLANRTALPFGSSEEYCLHLWWRPSPRDKIYQQPFRDVDELPQCENSRAATKYNWGANDSETGVSFHAWREVEQKLWCTNFTCEYDCNFHGGTYKDGKCLKYEVLRRLCLKIDITENAKDKAEEIEYVAGCYEEDGIGDYELATPNKTHVLDYVPFEVRYQYDPYTVFAEAHYNIGKDLTVFFWLSVACLSAAFLCTLVLGVFFCTISGSGRRKEKAAKGVYAKEDLN
jgi:hypothetical protein